MTEQKSLAKGITSVEVFLAHALVLEEEAVAGYVEIAGSLDVHNNPEVAALFKQMAKYGRLHASEVKALSAGMELPHIAPWEFVWQDGESPEAPAMETVHYMMKPAQALQLALRAEKAAHRFYADVASGTTDAKIKELASQFASEEAEHVRLLKEWIDRYPAAEETFDEDPDPPASPE